jgi:uncharacterized cupin superfamily protein
MRPSSGDGVLSAYTTVIGTIPVGTPAPPLHVHPTADEAFYVVEGQAGFQLGGQEITAVAGSLVFVPRGTVHTAWNNGDAPTRGLIIISPQPSSTSSLRSSPTANNSTPSRPNGTWTTRSRQALLLPRGSRSAGVRVALRQPAGHLQPPLGGVGPPPAMTGGAGRQRPVRPTSAILR